MRKTAFVPDFWIQSDLGDSALRTLLVLNLHRDGNNCVRMTNIELAAILNKDMRRVRDDLSLAAKKNLIVRKFDDNGKRYFELILNRNTEDGKRPGGTNTNPEGGRIASGGEDGNHPGGRTDSVHLPNNPLYMNNLKTTYKTTCDTREETIPLSQPKRVNLSVELRTELANWLMGSEGAFLAGADPDWSEDVIRWAIQQARKTNITHHSYLLKVIRNNWRPGWRDPDQLVKDREQEERERNRKRLEALK